MLLAHQNGINVDLAINNLGVQVWTGSVDEKQLRQMPLAEVV